MDLVIRRLRRRQINRHGVGHFILHFGTADRSHIAHARQTLHPIVPQFLFADHRTAPLFTQYRRPDSDVIERFTKSIAQTTHTCIVRMLIFIACTRRAAVDAVVKAFTVDVAVGSHRILYWSYSQGICRTTFCSLMFFFFFCWISFVSFTLCYISFLRRSWLVWQHIHSFCWMLAVKHSGKSWTIMYIILKHSAIPLNFVLAFSYSSMVHGFYYSNPVSSACLVDLNKKKNKNHFSNWFCVVFSGGAIRAFMMGIHAYFNIWCEARAGWGVFMKRRTAVHKISSLPEASTQQLQRFDDVCAICYQVTGMFSI